MKSQPQSRSHGPFARCCWVNTDRGERTLKFPGKHHQAGGHVDQSGQTHACVQLLKRYIIKALSKLLIKQRSSPCSGLLASSTELVAVSDAASLSSASSWARSSASFSRCFFDLQTASKGHARCSFRAEHSSLCRPSRLCMQARGLLIPAFSMGALVIERPQCPVCSAALQACWALIRSSAGARY